MSGLLIEELKFAKGLDPVADAFDSTIYTDIIDMGDFQRLLFAIHVGVGVTGTSTLTVEASDDNAGSNVSAIPFHYRQILTGDVEGALTLATSAGFVTTAGSSKIVLVEIREDALVPSGYRYVRLKAVESVNSPVLGGILVLGEPKVEGSSPRASSLD